MSSYRYELWVPGVVVITGALFLFALSFAGDVGGVLMLPVWLLFTCVILGIAFEATRIVSEDILSRNSMFDSFSNLALTVVGFSSVLSLGVINTEFLPGAFAFVTFGFGICAIWYAKLQL